ncbi:MAG: alanine--tRNA ligase [Patescibacteria group bacterium]|nr:alanine--tRNA ligase [Patescibacteria group bacterium]
MTLNEIRRRYLDFFRTRGHTVLPSAPLVPENDPTTLFVSSGMQPLIPYFLGQPHPVGTRIANSQKALRTQDIEEVGDNRHTTFFEMLGNWSFGDYFKKEEIPWLYQFLTEEIGLPAERLFVSCFEGDDIFHIPRDEESAEIWKSLGIPSERIYFYGSEKNWWSRAGTPKQMPTGEPAGPDTEVFYDFGTPHDPVYGNECHPNCDCGRFMEIGNAVFMMYVKKDEHTFDLLPKRNVDFGGGLERIAAALNNKNDIFLIDPLQTIIRELAAGSGKNYDDLDYRASFRIVTDHVRAAVFMLGDGVLPSNTERGYVLRRLIRRAVRHANTLGVKEKTIGRIIDGIIAIYRAEYPALSASHSAILAGFAEEENRFKKTLSQGMKEFEKVVAKGAVAGEDAFILFTTYGFPYELTEELARERGASISRDEYEKAMRAHQDLSRAGASRKFAGGLADHSEATIRYHTTHHILLKALRTILGPDVHQRGSNITAERLRMDFSSPAKMTPEQIAEAERLVNEIIREELPVIRTVMPKAQAEKLDAEREFGVTYPEIVSVYSIGPKDATEADPKFSQAYSIEFCGGPHVTNTAEIHKGGTFRILKEEAVGSGVRRIKAVLE